MDTETKSGRNSYNECESVLGIVARSSRNVREKAFLGKLWNVGTGDPRRVNSQR